MPVPVNDGMYCIVFVFLDFLSSINGKAHYVLHGIMYIRTDILSIEAPDHTNIPKAHVLVKRHHESRGKFHPKEQCTAIRKPHQN